MPHSKTIAIALILIALTALWPAARAWSYTYVPLFGLSNDGEPQPGLSTTSSGYNIHNRSSAGDVYNYIYKGYESSDFTGYYIGTISGNSNSRNYKPFDTLIKMYLGDVFSLNLTKLNVNYDDFAEYDEGSATDGTITLTVSWKTFKDGNENEPIGGEWSLTEAFGFGFYAVKGATEFALYYVDPARNSGRWTTRHLLNGGGNIPSLSHLSGAPTHIPAPAPGTAVMLGCGLLGLSLLARPRK
jgi:hypothetical protein